MSSNGSNYGQMWEDFAQRKSKTYNASKFTPVNRVGLTNRVREKKIIEFTLRVPHDEILDIGCASGRQVFLLAPHCKRAVGIDIAQSFVDECNEQKKVLGAANTEFYLGDFDKMPAGQFDVVICGEVLEHVLDLPFTIDAIDGAIKKGGHALITVPHKNADATWWGRILRLVGARSFTPFTSFTDEDIAVHGDAHVREFSRKSLSQHFIDRGYAIEKCISVSHLDGPLGDKIQDFFLFRMPFTRPFFLGLDRVCQALFPGLGRHIALLARKPS